MNDLGEQAEWDRPDVLAVVFHPRPESLPPDSVQEITIPVEKDVVLGGRLAPAGNRAPLILFFHGNGELASDYRDIATLYTGLGLSFIAVDFRGYGRSSGSPTVTNLLSDALAVWEHLPVLLAGQGLDPCCLYVMGRSLGSASALQIASSATSRPPDGLIIESGFAFTAELVARLGGPLLMDHDDGRHGLSHLTKIEAATMPTLILHGEADWIIPLKDAQMLYEHSGAVSRRLITIPQAGHNDLLWLGQNAYFEAIREFCCKRP